MHHEDGGSLSPDFEHCGVDDVGKGALRIIRNCFTKSRRVVASSEEISLTSCEANNVSKFSKAIINRSLPSLVSGEGLEILGLELLDDWLGELCLR